MDKSFGRSRALFLFLVLFFGNSVGICDFQVEYFSAYESSGGTSLYDIEMDIRKYLCHYNICPSNSISIIRESNTEYLGYYVPEKKQIILNSRLNSIEEKLTLVHEFVHVFRKEMNPNETRWLEEGLAKWWEYKYSQVWPQSYNLRFSKKPVFFLSNDETYYGRNGEGYISSFFLLAYLHRHFGGDLLIHKLMTSKQTGWDNILNSIHDLIDANIISIPHNLITKENIIRHLAVGLWINDPYAAKYALFLIDENFEPLKKGPFYSPPLSTNDEKGNAVFDTFVVFKNKMDSVTQSFSGVEKYAIENYEPLKIGKPTDESTGLVYIEIHR
ncbi:MAG: hypothetical protein ACXVCN_19470 [Bdellovibrio sp.]